MEENRIWYSYQHTPDNGEEQYLRMECTNISEKDQEIVKTKMQEIAEEIWK